MLKKIYKSVCYKSEIIKKSHIQIILIKKYDIRMSVKKLLFVEREFVIFLVNKMFLNGK